MSVLTQVMQSYPRPSGSISNKQERLHSTSCKLESGLLVEPYSMFRSPSFVAAPMATQTSELNSDKSFSKD